MKRAVGVLIALLMFFIGAGSVTAQGFTGISMFPGGSLFSPIPGLGSCDFGGLKLTADARAGYQWIGLNFNLPTSSPFGVGDGFAPIDIQLRDAHVWVGSVGLDAQLTPRLTLFVQGEANAKTKAGVVASDDPFLHLNGRGRYRWDASGLEWWALEAGATYRVFDDGVIFAGLRRDYLSFGLTDPRDQFGDPINFAISFPGLLLTGTNIADFQLNFWAPYLGLRILGTNYRASLVWSPFVNAAVKIPDSFAFNLALPSVPLSLGLDLEWRYSMFQTGTLLEGELEYDVRLGSNLLINAWGKGSWLRIRGSGNLEKTRDLNLSVLSVSISDSLQGGQSATGTLSRNIIAVGLAAKLEF